MKKLFAITAICATSLLALNAQAADQEILDRLEALEQQAEQNKSGFILSGKKNIKTTLYGQINKAVMLTDDGHDDDIFFVDNDASSTRFGIKAKTEIDNWTAGAQFEGEVQGNDSNKVGMGNSEYPSGGADQTYSAEFKKRQMKIWVKSKSVGKFTLGHGSVATDGIAEKDLSGTSLAGSSHIKISGAGFEFWNSDTDAYDGPKVGDVFNHLDGGRMAMVRYDSPSLAGVSISAVGGEENYSDIAINYKNKFDAFKIVAGLGYSYKGVDASPRNRISGSASILLNMGLNFTLAGGEAEYDDTVPSRDDGSYIYGKIGYKLKVLDIGSTAISFDYGTFDDFAGNDTEGEVYGLQLVQKISDLSTELYVGLRNFEYDDDVAGNDYGSIQTTMMGARFKF